MKVTRSSQLKCSIKTDVLKNFTKFSPALESLYQKLWEEEPWCIQSSEKHCKMELYANIVKGFSDGVGY